MIVHRFSVAPRRRAATTGSVGAILSRRRRATDAYPTHACRALVAPVSHDRRSAVASLSRRGRDHGAFAIKQLQRLHILNIRAANFGGPHL